MSGFALRAEGMDAVDQCDPPEMRVLRDLSVSPVSKRNGDFGSGNYLLFAIDGNGATTAGAKVDTEK